MFVPMPSPRGTNHADLFIEGGSPRAAYDALPHGMRRPRLPSDHRSRARDELRSAMDDEDDFRACVDLVERMTDDEIERLQDMLGEAQDRRARAHDRRRARDQELPIGTSGRSGEGFRIEQRDQPNCAMLEARRGPRDRGDRPEFREGENRFGGRAGLAGDARPNFLNAALARIGRNADGMPATNARSIPAVALDGRRGSSPLAMASRLKVLP